MAGEDQDLIRAGELGECFGGFTGSVGIEVYDHFIDDDGEAGFLFGELLDEAEAEGEVKLFPCASA
jgi:hypothetical protein